MLLTFNLDGVFLIAHRLSVLVGIVHLLHQFSLGIGRQALPQPVANYK